MDQARGHTMTPARDPNSILFKSAELHMQPLLGLRNKSYLTMNPVYMILWPRTTSGRMAYLTPEF